MPVNRVAVIGAGITGLTTAAILKRKGQPFDLFDRRGEPGGVIKTEQNGPWRYEYGPNTLLLKDADVKKFIESLGLKNQLKEANPEAAKRFVVKNGVLEPLPISVGGFLKTPLFSTAAKLRILKEPFVGTLQKEVTVAEFFEKRFGKEILDYAVNPFIAGIHAGRPESLSLQHAFPNIHQLEQEFGSVLYGAVRSTLGGGKKKEKKINRKLISFSEGLQQLPRAIVSELGDTYLNHEVKRINDENGTFTLETHMGSFGPYSNVVCTLPLHKWNKRLLPLSDDQYAAIRNVNYPPLSSLILGYKKGQISHPLDGFGFLVPEKEEKSILGALITSTLFENRAPEDHHLLTVFIGGGRQPELATMDSSNLLKMAEHDLAELIGLKGTAVFKDHIFWPRSIPQYSPGYDRVLNIFEELEMDHPGLHLAGNFRGGISVPDCIKNGLRLGHALCR